MRPGWRPPVARTPGLARENRFGEPMPRLGTEIAGPREGAGGARPGAGEAPLALRLASPPSGDGSLAADMGSPHPRP